MTGRWVRFTWHFHLDTNGWVELYFDGLQQPLMANHSEPSTTVLRQNVSTIDGAIAQGPWYGGLRNYYQRHAMSEATLYVRDYRIETSHAAAEGD